jgi:hypothetical protein
MLKDECGSVLSAMNRPTGEAQNSRYFLNDLYECDRIDQRVLAAKQTKKGEKIQNVWSVEDPYGTLSWITTPATFSRCTTLEDLQSGLLYRWLFFNPNYNRKVPPLGVMKETFNSDFNLIKKEMMRVSNSVVEKKRRKLTLSFASITEWMSWQQEHMSQIEKTHNDLAGTIFSRHTVTPLKLAMNYTIGSEEFINDKSTDDYEMNPEHVRVALKQMDDYFLIHGYETLRSVGLGQVLDRVEKVEALLRSNGYIMPIREVYRALNCSRKQIQEIFDVGLDLRETLKLVMVEGKKMVVYTPNTSVLS